MLNVIYAECGKKNIFAECRKKIVYAECLYAECQYAECQYAERQYAECHYAECHGTKIASYAVTSLRALKSSLQRRRFHRKNRQQPQWL